MSKIRLHFLILHMHPVKSASFVKYLAFHNKRVKGSLKSVLNLSSINRRRLMTMNKARKGESELELKQRNNRHVKY